MGIRRNFGAGLLVGAVIAVIFAAGLTAGITFERQQGGAATSDPNLREFVTAYHLVTQRSYFKPLNRKHLIYAAIDAMLTATGDPHTLFFSPPANRAATQDMNGTQFTGIGAIVQPDGTNLEILAPLPHSPALAAGLRSGDIVIAIDGRPVRSLPNGAAVSRIHGRAGTIVSLTVRRGHRTLRIRVRRATIPATTAYPRLLSHHIGYLSIESFGSTTPDDVRQSLDFLQSHGAHKIILDLRQDPGGYVDAAQDVVSDFVRSGVVAYEKDSKGHVTALDVIPSGNVVTDPIVVLVDSGTASAAEITAAALRDHHRAILVGERTYGKGSMQSVYTMSDGSSIRITDRMWLTPNRKSVQGIGLKPAIVVDAGADPNRDPQLEAAEAYLTHRAP